MTPNARCARRIGAPSSQAAPTAGDGLRVHLGLRIFRLQQATGEQFVQSRASRSQVKKLSTE